MNSNATIPTQKGFLKTNQERTEERTKEGRKRRQKDRKTEIKERKT